VNLGDIGIMGESIHCRCGPQRLHTEAVDLGADARFQAVFPNEIERLSRLLRRASGRSVEVPSISASCLAFFCAVRSKRQVVSAAQRSARPSWGLRFSSGRFDLRRMRCDGDPCIGFSRVKVRVSILPLSIGIFPLSTEQTPSGN
jgi:hypothetical protein